jgi:hypothetical protein
MKQTLAIAALAFLPALSPAQAPAADPLAFLGWMKDLAGACWEGRDAQGRLTDRQCYELQFGRFLRGTIEIGAVSLSEAVVEGEAWQETLVVDYRRLPK